MTSASTRQSLSVVRRRAVRYPDHALSELVVALVDELSTALTRIDILEKETSPHKLAWYE